VPKIPSPKQRVGCAAARCYRWKTQSLFFITYHGRRSFGAMTVVFAKPTGLLKSIWMTNAKTRCGFSNHPALAHGLNRLKMHRVHSSSPPHNPFWLTKFGDETFWEAATERRGLLVSATSYRHGGHVARKLTSLVPAISQLEERVWRNR
jgi:hypothetical protein